MIFLKIDIPTGAQLSVNGTFDGLFYIESRTASNKWQIQLTKEQAKAIGHGLLKITGEEAKHG